MSTAICRASGFLCDRNGCLFVFIRRIRNIRFLVLCRMLHQLIRPVSACIFLPAVRFLQGDLYSFCQGWIQKDIFIISDTVLCQSISIGYVFHLCFQILFDQIICFCFGHVLSKMNTLFISIILQSFLCRFFLFCIHCCQRIVSVIRHLISFQTVCHSPCHGSSICRRSAYLKLCVIILICIARRVSIAVKHIERIQVIQIVGRQSKLDTAQSLSILVLLMYRNTLTVISVICCCLISWQFR